MCSSAPVMYDDASDARNSTRFAMSAGYAVAAEAHHRQHVLLEAQAFGDEHRRVDDAGVHGVHADAVAPSSSAAVLVRPRTAHFVAPYAV